MIRIGNLGVSLIVPGLYTTKGLHNFEIQSVQSGKSNEDFLEKDKIGDREVSGGFFQKEKKRL